MSDAASQPTPPPRPPGRPDGRQRRGADRPGDDAPRRTSARARARSWRPSATAATPRCGMPTPASAAACTEPARRARPDASRRTSCARRVTACPRDLRAGLERMAANIERFHAVQVPPAEQWVSVEPGVEVGRVWRGLDRVAAYVPGGTAAYPSSLLMSAIPARLAGVGALRRGQPGRPGRGALPGPARRRRAHGGRRALGHGRRPGDRRPGLRHRVDRAAWTRSWGRATPGSPPPSSRSLDRCAIDMPAGPTEVMVVADDDAPNPSTSPPTCSARPSTVPTPLPCS